MFKAVISLFAIFFLISFTLIVGLFNVFDDRLFFYSDPQNIVRFCSFLSAATALILSFLVVPFLRRRGIVEKAALIGASMILTGFLFFLLDAFSRLFAILPLLKKLKLEAFVVFLWPAIFAVIVTKAFKSNARITITARMIRTAIVLLPIFLILGALPNLRNNASSQPKHVVLLVLDAMPSQYLHTFNHSVEQVELDEQLKHALVFRNMRTRAPWTNGYFRNLYNGGPENTTQKWDSTFSRWKNNLLRPQWNLLAGLQESNVKTRWIVWHNAGIPETCQITKYQGFRSILLGHRFSPLWNRIGMDYNMIITTPATENLRTARRNPVYRVLNEDQPFHNILLELLLPEMENIKKKSDRSFLMFHTSWSMSHNRARAVWQYDQLGDTRDRIAERIVHAENKYEPEVEWFAQQIEKGFMNTMAVTQKKISIFLRECRKRNLLNDTLFILTADHGEMASRGRLWYGYHPEEEVLRVPTAVFYRGKSGIDDRDLQTDHLVKTITNFFQVKGPAHSNEQSMLNTGSQPYTASMTLSSDVNREWFIVLYHHDQKYVFNIHPKGSGEAMKFRVQVAGFNTVMLAEGQAVLNEVKPFLKQALQEFRIASSAVHPSYRM